jgi:D-alanine-D-alanine ligase
MQGIFEEIRLFLTSAFFLRNFAKMVAVVGGLLLLTTWWMRCYTQHGESVQVDDFTGMRLEDALEKGSDKDFRFEIMDSVWKEGTPSGIIILQNPKPLSRVKEGRKIYVTVTGQAEPELLPKFAESSYDFDRYRLKIEKRGIKVREKERIFDARQAENTILYFYHNGRKVTEGMVNSGYYVVPGDVLEFVVTEQQSNVVEIPDLVCMDYAAAEFLVSTSNLNIGTVTPDGTVVDPATAFIYRQEPPFVPATTIPMGTQISIWLTQELPSDCGTGADGGNY